MKEKVVEVSEEARRDLESIHDWIAEHASGDVALEFILRVSRHLETLRHSYGRGTDLSDIRPLLRSAGFERRLTIVYRNGREQVDILRVFYRGRDWEAILAQWLDEGES